MFSCLIERGLCNDVSCSCARWYSCHYSADYVYHTKATLHVVPSTSCCKHLDMVHNTLRFHELCSSPVSNVCFDMLHAYTFRLLPVSSTAMREVFDMQ